MLVDVLFGKIDVTPAPVNVEDLADNLLALPDVVTDILDPAGCDFRDGDEPLPATILVKRYERDEILDIFYGTDYQFRFLWPLPVSFPAWNGSLEFWGLISAFKFAFPPVGVARSRPQTTHLTVVLALEKIVCSLSQSGHFTFKKLLRFARASRTMFLTPSIRTCNPVPFLRCAFPQVVQRYRTLIFFVGLSPPGTFENFPMLPTLPLRAFWRSIQWRPVVLLFLTFSTSWIW